MLAAANDDDGFKTDLIALIPKMRGFARSLCGHRTQAEDLVQDVLAKAWSSRSSFIPGTNLQAWTFTILRNGFYSEKRRSWRSCALDPEVAERTLIAVGDPSSNLELDELRRALAMLPDDQREALILVGAGGFSCDDAAEICGVAVGTIKSRVSRARDRLALIYAEGLIVKDDVRPRSAMHAIYQQVDDYRLAACA